MKTLLALLLISASGAFAQLPAAGQVPEPFWQPLDNNGKTVPGGKICTYATSSFSPQATFTSNTGGVQLSNPIILDSAGRASIWWGDGLTYRVVFQQPGNNFCPGTGATIWTQDGVVNFASLFGTAGGSSYVGFQQVGGIVTNVQTALRLCPDASQYVSFAVAIASIPSGGCLDASSPLTGPVTIGGNGVTIHGQPGCVITPTSSAPAVTISGSNISFEGCTINGTGYSANGITISGATNVVVKNTIVTTAGGYGILLDGSTSGNSHVKILDSTFSLNHDDAIFSQGGMIDLEIAGNHADCSAEALTTHCFAVHSAYGASTGSDYGVVTDIGIHDNVELCGVNDICNEIGSFLTALPQIAPEIPVRLTMSGNKMLGSSSGSYACDSLGNVYDFSLDGEECDYNGASFGIAAFEIYGTNGSARGLVAENCVNTQFLAVSLFVSNFSLSDSTLCAIVYSATPNPLFYGATMSNIHIHHNNIALQSMSSPSISGWGCIGFQPNGTGATLTDLHVDHNSCTGVSTSDGAALVAIVNGTCSAITDIHIDDNTANSIEYGYNNESGCVPTGVVYADNLLGSGVTQFGNTAGSQGAWYDNPGFAGNRPWAPQPSGCTMGAASGWSGGTTCASTVNYAFSGNAMAGFIWFTTAGSGETTGTLFSIAVPSGTFPGAIAPLCIAQNSYSPSTILQVQMDQDISTATALNFTTYTAPATGSLYRVSWICSAANQ